MEYSSALELRNRWLERLRAERAGPFGTETTQEAFGPQVAVGVTGDEGDYRIAIRVGRLDAVTAPLVDAMREESRGEVDIREIGDIEGIAKPPRVRPLVAGISVGNEFGEVGTLGCLVRKRGTTAPFFILSNNHVLARLDSASPGEAILQPAFLDQSGSGPFGVAEFGEAVALKPTANVVDAAIVPLLAGVTFDTRALFGVTERLAGQRAADLREDEPVSKVGRSTQKTTGTIKAWGLSGLLVKLGSLQFEFDEQIEIVPDLTQFCDDGDSGSIVVDAANLAVGLLFSKSRATEHAYANPIDRVFSKLGIELA
ncbi:MAG TPA: hypothetical protein VKM72_33945 [Thermoanaerobaculia bacterium]|nr:hypothetical protein [Thermoanaerobaculia bacterium]